jgi:hypothetical protein
VLSANSALHPAVDCVLNDFDRIARIIVLVDFVAELYELPSVIFANHGRKILGGLIVAGRGDAAEMRVGPDHQSGNAEIRAQSRARQAMPSARCSKLPRLPPACSALRQQPK